MYAVDDRDVVVPLTNLPAPDAGAPKPVVLADENRAIVAYYAPDWDTAKPEDLGDEEVAVLRFDAVLSFMFGDPNDEALNGHPLFERGLQFYAAHRVEQSSWVRQLELMNRVHPLHNAEAFSRLRHFIVTFHDSTFECVCPRDPAVSVVRGTTPARAVLGDP